MMRMMMTTRTAMMIPAKGGNDGPPITPDDHSLDDSIPGLSPDSDSDSESEGKGKDSNDDKSQ